jgi:hypothetical protein
VWVRAAPVLTRFEDLARRRDEHRDRAIDLVRAVAVVPVVLGHWLVIAVTGTGVDLDGVNLLGELGWTHLLSWLFQVMPVFFFVGGYANAASFDRHRRSGGDRTAWVLGRYDRLVRPTAALLATLVSVAVVARALGVDTETAATGAWLATVPMWFLLVYLVVVAVAPWAIAAHRRWGLAVPLVLAGSVAAGDWGRYGLGDPRLAEASYILMWAAVHQVGVAAQAARDRPLTAVGLGVAAGGLGLLIGLVTLGPYPVSMVSVPGGDQNSEPPTLALLALALTQVGLVLAVVERARRWLDVPRRWVVVTATNTVVLTVFLWHMAAALIAALVLHGTGWLAPETIGSGTWYLQRIPWVLTCAAALIVLVTVFSRVETGAVGLRSGSRVEHPAARAAVVLGVAALLVGLVSIALTGPGSTAPLGLPTPALVAVAVGCGLLAGVRPSPATPLTATPT